MAVTRDNARAASQLASVLDDIEVALAILAEPNPQIAVEVSSGPRAGVRIPLSVNPATLTNLLNTRKTALEAQLAALGVS